MPEESIFTKIINGEIPSFKLYEDDKTFAFLDINPLSKGHTLVVPKTRVDNLWDLTHEDYEALLLAAKKIAAHLGEHIDCKRVGMAVEGFEVAHAHIHLIPLNKGLKATFAESSKQPADASELAALAERLRLEDVR